MSSSSSVTYSSTRGGETQIDFRTAVMQGLARDRGLFVPDSIPTVSADELKSWRNLTFPDLAVEVLHKFIQADQMPFEKLKDIVHRSCAAFAEPNIVTPVVPVGGHYILELFHGPTFAFKDVALQMLGNFFEYFLATGSNAGRLAVLGATSGDTGSAAIAGLRGKRGIDCIILFPHQRVSPIQERQMTTIMDANIHCVAIQDGTFDDCQDYVKASFDTPDFRDEVHLGAVNSINWCRVLAQTTYYFWSYLRVTDISKDVKEVHYSVPTGNFGDVLAGYYARCMGLPVGKLIVATNENDILHRFFTKGEYHRHDIAETISPSMDICVSSNFERYLYALAGNDAKKLKAWMDAFESSSSTSSGSGSSAGKLTLSGDDLRRAQMDFDSARADTKMTLQTIRDYHEQYNYVLCPHSAVGVNAIHQLQLVSTATVCLATAHHAKFPDAVLAALETSSQKDKPLNPASPSALTDLEHLPTRVTVLRKDLKRVQRFVLECVFGRRRNWLSLSQLQDKDDRVKVIMATAILAGVAAVVVMQILAKKR